MSSWTWRRRITAAIKRGEFTLRDKELSGDWPSCAVGEQHERAPEVVKFGDEFGFFHGPVDNKLNRAGICFDRAVQADEPRLAEKIYGKIRARTAMLRRFGAS